MTKNPEEGNWFEHPIKLIGRLLIKFTVAYDHIGSKWSSLFKKPKKHLNQKKPKKHFPGQNYLF